MTYKVLPLIVVTAFFGLGAVARELAQQTVPAPVVLRAEVAGQSFLAYRNALMVYQRLNPSFTGTVPSAALTAQGSQFSAEFLATAGNAVTPVGTVGRVITAYATLPAGGLKAAVAASDSDASLGTASGSTWSSYVTGAGPTALPTAVPDGAAVAIIQIGN